MSDSEQTQSPFYVIPAELAESGNFLNALLYGLITTLANKKGYCFATNKYLAEKLERKSVSIISNCISELERDGWIKVIVEKNYKRKIWLNIGREGYVKNHKGAYEKSQGGVYEKPQDSNINNIVIKDSNPQEEEKKEKNKSTEQTDKPHPEKIKMSAIENSNRVDKFKKILPSNYLPVLNAYREIINRNCNARTANVVENIPKTVKKFEEFFGSEGQEKFILAIKTFLNSGNWKEWLLKNPGAKSPKTFLSVKFAENHLIPLVTNPPKDEHLSETPLSKEELREAEETTSRALKEALAPDRGK